MMRCQEANESGRKVITAKLQRLLRAWLMNALNVHIIQSVPKRMVPVTEICCNEILPFFYEHPVHAAGFVSNKKKVVRLCLI
jgi:hypothetical protein